MRKTRKERLEEERELPKQQKTKNKVIFRGIVLCVFVFFFIKGFAFGDLSDKLGKGAEMAEKETPIPLSDSWELILVSKDVPLEQDFRVTLGEVDGGKIDVRIGEDLMTMISAAEKEGIVLEIQSSYRNVAKQKELYESQIAMNLEKGMKEEKAVAKAEKYVSPPGASEHHTGLAIDFTTTDQKEDLTEEFAKSPAYEWLMAHGAEYGFVERYGKKKQKHTGIAWEPWHFRYVGVENAEAMVVENLSLEEYLKQKA